MSGIFGGGSAGTDRGNQLSATQADWGIYGYGIPTGQASQAAGSSTLNGALQGLGLPANYYQNLLTAGRTQTEANAAPAINSVEASTDATRNSAGNFGTNRTGGTASLNRTAQTGQNSKVDDIISSTLQTGKATGAQGLTGISSIEAGIGGEQLQNALQLLGLSSNSVNSILTNATGSKQVDQQNQNQLGGQLGQSLGTILPLLLGL